jgi:hypothetical protein
MIDVTGRLSIYF